MKQKNKYAGSDFTFVVCAYKECAYLKICVASLVNQSVKAKIIISTSTPNQYIKTVADRFHLEIRVNPHGGNQVRDYNFAIKQADTDLVMLVHQDEIFLTDFVKRVIEELNRAYKPIIAFTGYREIHNDVLDKKPSVMIRMKEMMLFPLRFKGAGRHRFVKRAVMCFGNPITHPTVVCIRKELPTEVFNEKYEAAPDWDLWERLSKQDGSFVYVRDVLMHHRMSDDSLTVHILNTSNTRYKEEYEIMCRFWPKYIAGFIMRFYSKSVRYYKE